MGSFLEVRSNLREFIRSESLAVIREISDRNTEHKILILDFLVRAFALAGDVEARDFYSATFTEYIILEIYVVRFFSFLGEIILNIANRFSPISCLHD